MKAEEFYKKIENYIPLPNMSYCDLYELMEEYAQSQLEKVEVKLDDSDPYLCILTNPKGDTYAFNPASGLGEDLYDFFFYLTQNKEDES